MSQYEKLLEELETMAKAMPGDDGADDDKIQAAAAAANPDADGDGKNDVTGDDLNPEGGKGLGGRQRKAGDKRKNVRDAFRNAVDRAIKQIEKYDKPLAEHLKAAIKISNEVAYRPGMSITWDVRPIVNG